MNRLRAFIKYQRWLPLILATLLSGCNDGSQPILRGVKQTQQSVLNQEADKPQKAAIKTAGHNELNSSEFNSDVNHAAQQQTATDRSPLNLNLPDALKYPQSDGSSAWAGKAQYSWKAQTSWKAQPSGKPHAKVDKYRLFPDFFQDRASSNTDESAVDFSGKVHWDEAFETDNQPIPSLNTIEGLELEISVKTH